MKTQAQILSLLIGTILLSSCVTPDFKEAEPEKYAGLSCEQLDELAESFRISAQNDPYADIDINELERTNSNNRSIQPGQSYAGERNYEVEINRDRRSIALARRQKDCI